MASNLARSSDSSSSNFSKYYSQLPFDAQARYRQKLRLLGNIDDPYRFFEGRRKRSAATRDEVETAVLAENSVQQQVYLSWDSWPNIGFPDIYSFLIERNSEFTRESLKAYKSL